MLDIDIQGTETFLESFPQTNTLFIYPTDFDALEKRLRGRGTETEENIQKRLSNAKSEIDIGLNEKDPR